MAATNTAVSDQKVTRRGLFRRLAGARTVEAVRPPGALPERRFLDACSGCGDCADACPTGVIVMASGVPEVNFSKAGCEFCGACADACRPGAIRPASEAAPGPAWTHGIAIGAGCLSAAGVVCRVCGEQCEAGAIRFRLSVGGRSSPELDPDLCTGCGACVGPCPAGAVAVTFAA
ncbi:Ferredoxin-type protein NapF (periplasmic nitrate reductase) [Caenispirillum salinarum AK4]|uniref:Ferredoxin-type protein NapF n=1 Tax=Caenispirillum salinarum AK4 TaxID=1238182 RepID=K9HLU9_9PROT|nr:ferredoxin-type protein NapF [Caenispirillum salinarum]EKV31323.1 Ferredoxin-type protein NapF (periplasmic nitrate reductase) [Caenispirillum salinarum AK4]